MATMDESLRRTAAPTLVLPVVLVALCILQTPALAAKRTALVIGNGAYKDSPLRNPINDAEDMARMLKDLGFEVIHKTNLARTQMREAIRQFGTRLREADVGLFYFAGHGVQVDGKNYLVPIGTDIEAEDETEDEAVDAGLVLRKMESAGNPVNLVILDACRNNPFERSFRTSSRGLAGMEGPTGSFIAYATAPGSVAKDGEGRNGTYTKHLLKNMRQPGVDIAKMFRQVRVGVMKDTDDKQVPWNSSSLTGDFYFITEGNKPVVAEPVLPGPANTTAVELAFWDSVENSTDPAAYKAYLEKYPNGQFVSIAKLRLAKLKTAAPKTTGTTVSPPADSPGVKVAALLEECEGHLKANRLLTGSGGTAVSCYAAVLQTDRDNGRALAGLNKVAEKYAGWAEGAVNQGNKSEAEKYLARLEKVNPEHPKVAEIKESMKGMQLAEARAHREAAERAARAAELARLEAAQERRKAEETRRRAAEEARRRAAEEERKRKLTWTISNRGSKRISLKFFSQVRNHIWPGSRRHWLIEAYNDRTYNLSCQLGEKICYGAWADGGSWGTGRKGKKGCERCCRTCGSTGTNTLVE